jgi:hypothetical protein
MIVISLPEELGVAVGTFDGAALEREAHAKGWKSESTSGLRLFADPSKPKDALALVDSTTALVGSREVIVKAAARAKTAVAPPALYSRAIALGSDWDFWIAADKLDTAKEWMPDVTTISKQDLQGVVAMDLGMRIRTGISLKSVMTARNEEDAKRLFAKMQPDPETAKLGVANVSRSGRTVSAEITVDFAKLMEGLAEGMKQSFEQLGREMQKEMAGKAAGTSGRAAAAPSPAPEPELPPEKRVIRITGLDDGPREIPLLKPGEQRPEKKQ